jgi:nicotinate-nucleotide adenylyltransferase
MSSAGIYGGNFDPVHNGHLITAMKVFGERKLDKILFIPAYISPFKEGIKAADPLHRINMLKEAISGVSFFDYSDIEIKSGGVSYTVETLRELKKHYDRLELIIGYDNLLEFPKWKEPDEILKLARVLVLKRNQQNIKDERNRFFEQVVFPDTPVIEISSTDIRERVKYNLPIDFLVPDKVKEYIYKNNLYKE